MPELRTPEQIRDHLVKHVRGALKLVRELTNQPKEHIAVILGSLGTPGYCRGCGQAIWWVTHINGKPTMYTLDGLNHFINCPKASIFRYPERSPR